ncbi:hypothetical protein FOMPIDRAFT_94749 [Fomitopsis schrenkii]|uniref:Uncharacterized protein n=1 Tax=Fomitopsis schrenkii TaxID=2126942 RepID=S8DGT9_FOMSC|nr:hypothetical protein FOMPIDRAFT_94749 [Fomitopsis schrenkii]
MRAVRGRRREDGLPGVRRFKVAEGRVRPQGARSCHVFSVSAHPVQSLPPLQLWPAGAAFVRPAGRIAVPFSNGSGGPPLRMPPGAQLHGLQGSFHFSVYRLRGPPDDFAGHLW